jgi:CRP-like cAMP-binding protein
MFDFHKVERLKSKADNGDIKAQIDLGKEYFLGRNIPANLSKGYEYFTLAAKHNDPEALFCLAECQDTGNGCSINPTQAFHNLSKAAEQGHLKATLLLAKHLESGHYGIVDYQKSMQCYKSALNQGYAPAKDQIARIEKLRKEISTFGMPAQPTTQPKAGVSHNNPERPSKSEIKIDDIPFFRGLGASELVYMMGVVQNLKAKKGELLFCEGQPPNGLFIILSGGCSIRTTNSKANMSTEIKSAFAGDYVGEFGLIDGLARSATVVITEDANLMFLPTAVFHAVIQTQKNVADIVTQNLLASIRDKKILLKDKESKDLVYGGRPVPSNLSTMKKLTAILRASNTKGQMDYWDR